jgi:hypothetical protein
MLKPARIHLVTARKARACRVLLFVTSALVLAAAPTRGQVREIVVSGAPHCSGCRIELERVVTIGSTADENLYRQMSLLVQGPGPAYYVTSSYTPGVILVYDAAGRFLRTIGRSGGGPGELGGEPLLRVTPEDSLHVVSNGRLTVFPARSGAAARSWNYDVGVWGLTGMAGGITAAALAPNARQETVRLYNPDGTRRASIYFEGLLQHRDQLAQRVHASGDTLLLVSATGRYRIQAFDRDGRLRWTVDRQADWFPPYARQPRGAPVLTPSLPDIVGAWIESNRYLWVLLERPADDWRAVQVRGGTDALDFNALFGSQLEVIDLQSGRVLASRRLDWLRPAAERTPLVYTAGTASTGEVVFNVWRPTLVQSSNGGDS